MPLELADLKTPGAKGQLIISLFNEMTIKISTTFFDALTELNHLI